ncbi:helix-turn-helix domain-containing protein [Sporolactobacillus pectinivorans]|uniref:helix-turn-helix domain-containing protein n=1 Tax=Sporolactobacillus pectinivorans TaxID=1591408 RepID=UPI000C25D24C|nr:helix-turn-helix transcriptional regulator [Sporolactobacillus pectinivorans]
MDQLGFTLKKIRQSKKYTQKYVSSGKMSQSTYSKIESSKMTPTIDKFIHILERLDVTYSEVILYRNKYSIDEKEKIVHDFSHISTTIDSDKIVELELSCAQFLKATYDSVVQDIQLVCHSLLFVQSGNYEEARNSAEKVWDRLSKMDSWYSIELRLINNILYIFPSETQLSIGEIALKNLYRTSVNFKEHETLKIAFLLNMSLLLINQDKHKPALVYAEKALEESLKINRIDLISMSLERKGIIFVHTEEIERGLSLINKAIYINEAIGNNRFAEAIKEEVRQKTSVVNLNGLKYLDTLHLVGLKS